MAQIKMTRNNSQDERTEKLISSSMREILKEEIEIDTEGDVVVKRSRAEDLARNIYETARYDENPLVRRAFTQLLLEYTEGKPAVQTDNRKEMLPVLKFNLTLPAQQEELQDAKIDEPAFIIPRRLT